MMKMGFSHQWIKWIMMCVETVDYSIMFDGSTSGPIILGRGLRKETSSFPTCSLSMQ